MIFFNLVIFTFFNFKKYCHVSNQYRITW